MSPTELGSYTSRPEQVIAMHFFNPVHKMPLVEIARGLETSDQTTNAIRRAAEQMGKETVVVNEFPGFVKVASVRLSEMKLSICCRKVSGHQKRLIKR